MKTVPSYNGPEAASRQVDVGPPSSACEANMPDSCLLPGEHCVPYGGRRRDGVCRCSDGFDRNNVTGSCDAVHTIQSTAGGDTSVITAVPHTDTIVSADDVASAESNLADSNTNQTLSTPIVKPRILNVSVNNKTIKLQEGKNVYEQKVTLSAYVIGGKTVFYHCFIT